MPRSLPLSFVTGGIVMMYFSYITVLGTFVRGGLVSNRMASVKFEEMGDVDYLVGLLDNILLARELQDYWLEEELVAKLIFILRSSDILFYVSRLRNIQRLQPQSSSNKWEQESHRNMDKDRISIFQRPSLPKSILAMYTTAKKSSWRKKEQ